MIDQSTHLASLLVVDDTLENLRLLGTMLGEEGYEVRPVSSGRQALQAIDHDPPDLILLDVSMPDMDGYEVCRRVRENDQSKDVPVIFLTAWADRAYMVKAFEVGGADYVTKPFLFEEVLTRVNTHIALKRARAAVSDRDERLRELEQTRRDVRQMVVNDMQPPLMALTFNLMRLKERHTAGCDEEARGALDAAIAAGATINRVSSDLLGATRIEQDSPPVKPV